MFKREELDWLLEALGGVDEPLGLFYAETEPPDGFAPREGVTGGCLINFMRLAKERKRPAWFAKDRTGCRGGNSYLGFARPAPFIPDFVSVGTESMEGEHYLPSPDSVRRYLDEIDVQPAPAPYCVVKPLGQFAAGEEAVAVIFFERVEVLSGLCALAMFAFDDVHAVVSPFGSGCSTVLAWVDYYKRKGDRKAVLGGFDPSCRPFIGMDQLTFAVAGEDFAVMLAAARDSFLACRDWRKVRKKMGR